MQVKRKNVGFILLIIFYAFILLSIQGNALAQSWFSPDWGYRMRLTINNPSSSNSLTDYQVKVRLNHANFDFTKAKPKGEDIRFAASDGTTLINHWIEYWNNIAESALVWIKVPSVPASDSAVIYFYYGNLNANNSSNGKGTFEFFDDFESDYLAESGWSIKAPLPLVKADNAAAVYNNLLYVFGGYDRDPSCVKYYLDETFAYNPVTDAWTQLADMPTARWGPVAVESNGLIHVFAGEATSGLTGIHEVYNPTINTWSRWSDVPAGLADQGGMGIKYGNKIHLFLRQYHYEYDPATNIYTAKANVPTPRTWGTCALVNGLIYVIGGYSYGTPDGATNVNEVYNPVTDTWTTRAPIPVKGYGITRENPVIGGKIYVTHGRDGSFYTSNYVYDPSNNTWSKKSSGVNPRDGVGCGVINDKLYVVGGRDIFSCAVGRNYVEEYNPANDKGEVWVLSNTSVTKRDTLAKYEQAYGFLFDKSFSSDGISAQHYHNFTNCAVDVYWNITDYYGITTVQPQGAILLTDNPEDGCLHYFYNNGRPDFSWYRSGSYSSLQAGAWNNWLPVTIIWNGSNSKAIINGTEYPVSAANTNSNRVFLRVNKITREYFDLVRVRKYSSPEPGVTLGPAESSNHPPILTLRDTSFPLCNPETTCFSLMTTDPDSPEVLTLQKIFGSGNFTPLTGPPPLNVIHCFLPEPKDSTYLFVFRVTDSKGVFVQDSSFVHIHIDQSPILALPNDIDTQLCNLGDSIYLTIRGEDPDTGDTLTLEKISSPGVLLPTNPVSGTSPRLANFLWKPNYSDTSGNPHRIIFKLKDLCGKEVQDTLLISVKFNHLPVLTLPADTTYNLCKADTICFDHISATDSDLQDSVFIQKLSGPGGYNPGTGICCFLPSSKDSTYTFIFQAQDLCGASTLDTFNLTVHLNRIPTLSLPSDTFYKLCAPGDSILFEVSASDPGDSLSLTKLSIEGVLRPIDPVLSQDSVKGTFVWKPVYSDTLSNPHLLIFQVRDNCGLSHTDTVQIVIEFNHLPVLVTRNSSYRLCDDSTVCFNNLIGSDSDLEDSLSLQLVSGPNCLFLTTVLTPTLITGFTCFQTTGTNTVYPFIFELTDRCGAKDVDTVYITVSPPANLLIGDPNGDALVTVSDVIYIINYLFKSGPPPTNCPKSGDVNCDTKITVSDVVYLIGYLFKGGPPPCP